MSHYTVAVFHRADQDVGDLLAPYDESLKVEPYVRFTRDEAIAYARKHYKAVEDKTDDECWEMIANEYRWSADGEYDATDADGNIYSTYNPKSKWDWWAEGGRWAGDLLVNGEPADSGQMKDIEFTIDDDEYQNALGFWDEVVEGIKPADGEPCVPLYTPEYYRERYGDRDTYARYMTQFSTYAVVTPDGAWHAPGDMGWFGCSSESDEEWRDWQEHYKERFLDTADPEWYLTLVDCHI